ncbi:MAG: hypothetical protein NZM25_10015 [Leptospiraceae bacterium]|nr:hypothetical protein [Leptospiraceae bacterium]
MNLLCRIILWPLVLTPPLFANLADSFGFSAKGIAMAGARVANVNDWTSAYFNMAGLASPWPFLELSVYGTPITSPEGEPLSKDEIEALQKEERFYPSELGMSYLFQISVPVIEAASNHPTVKSNIEKATSNMSYGVVQLGLSFDFRNIVETPQNLPIKLGLALAIRDSGVVATVSDTSAESYNFLRLGREAQRLVLISGLGFQVWKDRLSLGAGASMFAGGQGKFKMTDVDIDPTTNEQIPEQEVLLELTPSIAPVVGIQYRQPLNIGTFLQRKELLIGIAYRGEQYMELNPLSATATTGLLYINLPLRLSVLDFYTPHTITYGISYFHTSDLRFHFDIEMQLWRNFRLSEAKDYYYKNKKNYQIDKFQNIYFYPKFASEIRLGTIIPQLRKEPLWARTGFAYQPAFTPDQVRETNFLDNDKFILALGVGYLLQPNKITKVATELNFGVQWQIWTERTSQKVIQDPLNPSYVYSADVIILALSASWRF